MAEPRQNVGIKCKNGRWGRGKKKEKGRRARGDGDVTSSEQRATVERRKRVSLVNVSFFIIERCRASTPIANPPSWFYDSTAVSRKRQSIVRRIRARKPLADLSFPNLRARRVKRDRNERTESAGRDISVRLLASPRATAITSASASHRQLSCRIYAVYERSSSNAEYARESVLCHSPRVCLATRAREVCRERPLNHNRNGGCIALRPKCTSPSGGAARGVGGGFLFACTAVFEAPNACARARAPRSTEFSAWSAIFPSCDDNRTTLRDSTPSSFVPIA